jgi:hypothetical protein
MLREAAHLRGFLPKGVVQSVEELSLLGAPGKTQRQQQHESAARGQPAW